MTHSAVMGFILIPVFLLHILLSVLCYNTSDNFDMQIMAPAGTVWPGSCLQVFHLTMEACEGAELVQHTLWVS